MPKEIIAENLDTALKVLIALDKELRTTHLPLEAFIKRCHIAARSSVNFDAIKDTDFTNAIRKTMFSTKGTKESRFRKTYSFLELIAFEKRMSHLAKLAGTASYTYTPFIYEPYSELGDVMNHIESYQFSRDRYNELKFTYPVNNYLMLFESTGTQLLIPNNPLLSKWGLTAVLSEHPTILYDHKGQPFTNVTASWIKETFNAVGIITDDKRIAELFVSDIEVLIASVDTDKSLKLCRYTRVPMFFS